MKSITPLQLRAMQEDGKNITIVDVRTPQEYHLEHIEGAVNMPLDRFEDHKDTLKTYERVVCYCNSGNSSSQFCKRAEHAGIDTILNLAGGLSSCKTCKTIKQKGPLPMMQQVQIAAGSLVLLGIILAKLFHPYSRHEYFIGISAFVGAGLIFAGVSGRCGMAKLLAAMPRNKLPNILPQTEIAGDNLIIKQFEDKNLAHYSYMALSDGQAIVIDPERDPSKYYEYAKQHNVEIVGVMNTHPHADFASGHLQIHKDTGATIYVGSKVGAEYPHQPLEGGETIPFGAASVVVYFTPGHSPDSMSYLVKDASGKELGLFTGDRLFIGDVGRADLRESVGNIKAKQAELAGMMYDTTRSILPTLPGDVYILPAHGAGTSCGKGLSKQNMDILDNQKKYNPMLQDMTKEVFVAELTSDQPAIPAYFTNSVLLNKQGNTNHQTALDTIPMLDVLPDDVVIVDTRSREHATNYPLGSHDSLVISYGTNAFVGMLGAMIQPNQRYVVAVEKKSDIPALLHDILSIGYEKNLVGVYCIEERGYHQYVVHKHDAERDKQFTILDVRSASAFKDNMLYPDAINIPIERLATQLHTLDKTKTYIPYCGGTYKSSIALSLLLAHGYKAKKMYV